MPIKNASVGFLLKPVGSTCNLRCDYCYYRRVGEKVYEGRPQGRFSRELLERVISEGMKHGYPTAQFSWQGGEPLLAGKDVSWREEWLYEYYEFPGPHSVRPHRGVRTRRYKLIHYYQPPEELELYDLEQDPQEQHNLAGDPAHADLVQQLLQRIGALREAVQGKN